MIFLLVQLSTEFLIQQLKLGQSSLITQSLTNTYSHQEIFQNGWYLQNRLFKVGIQINKDQF